MLPADAMRAPEVFERLVLALGLLLFALLAFETALRIPFPCDLMMWSESPFMTHLMKLANGLPIYSDPSELNSYIYAPGLEYLTYGVLAPLGLALDVRACRFVNVLIGLAAAACAAAIASRLEGDLRGGRPHMRFAAASFCAAALIVLNAQTADGLHPDNLHMLHASGTLLLCWSALTTGSALRAGVAIAVAGLGIVVKQPAAFAPLGVTAALLLGRRWGARRALVLALVATATCVLALAFAFADPNRRFFMLEVPSRAAILWFNGLIVLDAFLRGHRLLLATAVPLGLLRTVRAGPSGRSFILTWLFLGLTEVLPAVAPALKIWGVDNNLTILGLWLFLLGWPTLAHLVARPPQPNPLPAGLAGPIMLAILLALVPAKLRPSADAYAYCARLVESVGADVRAGRRVLLSAGTTPFILNHHTAVPLDRAATVSEVSLARRPDLTAAMNRRLASGYYQRVYLVGGSASSVKLDDSRWTEVEEIPRPAGPALGPLLRVYVAGHRFIFEMGAVKVYEPKEAR